MPEPIFYASVAAALIDRAARTPDRTAYIFLAEGEEEQERLTYAGLDARARAIAAALSRSVKAGERALLLYPPGLDFVAAFFGCLYAGVIAVPAYPPRSPRMMPRLLAILADAEPAVALAAGASLQRVRGWLERTPEGAAVSWIATGELDPAPAGWSYPAPDGDAVAFLQYTSGSTATPKGVMVTEANLVHNQRVIEEACGHSEESVFVSWLPVYHDLGLIGNLLQAVWVGAPCVLMAPVAFLQKPSRWLRAISRYGGTTSGGPNFAYDLCARRAEGADLAGIDLSSWRVAFNGAEPVLPKTLESFAAALAPYGFRAAAAYPCYGLAEATLMVSGGSPADPPRVSSFRAAALERGVAEPAEPGEPGARPLAGCGRPLGGQAVVIVNPETAEPLPSGRIGEIWIAGQSVARGYWGRPEETAETFGARLAGSGERAGGPAFLRTGDLGFLGGGELYVTGRIKDLIILRGRNFYPQDLELTAGNSHPDLRPGGGAAFSVKSGSVESGSVESSGEERLVLVHEVRRRPRADAAEIAAAIRAAFAEEHEAAVSDVVLILPETLPRTSSGKVRRRACREAYVAGELSVFGRSAVATTPAAATPSEDGAAPRTPTEELLAGIWADLLGLEWIGVHDDLFELGGHSLLAAQAVSRLHGALGVSLTLATLFEHPTVAQLAGAVDRELRGGTAGPEEPPLSRAPRGRPLPLSFAQERLWFLDRLAPGCAAYNIPAGLRLAGDLSVPALAAALAEVSRRHEALRTTFLETPEGPVQQIGGRPVLKLPAVDLTGCPEALREPELLRLAVAEAQRPFDLERGPLARATLVRRGEREHVLLLTLHHIVSDGWSMGVLVREVAELYEAFSQGRPSPLPELPVQSADCAVWQRRRLAEGALESRLAWWRGYLEGAPTVLDLPSDRPRPPAQSFRGRREPLLLGGELVLALRSLGRREGATLYMVLLSAFQILLARQGGQDDLLVGSPAAGRGRVEVEGLIGFFVNTLVLRGDLRSDPALRELLARTRTATLEAFDRQDVPFERLVEELDPERDLSRNPLFQAMLVLQNTPLPRLGLPGLEASLLEVDNGTSRFDLTLSLTEQDGALAGWMEHSEDLFDGATVRRMLDRLETLLGGLAGGAERRVSELPLLSAAEERQLLSEWDRAGADAPWDLGLHELFAAQAARTPGAAAVRHAEGDATYAELNRRANQLAHHLRRLGVKPEGRVGVLLDRKPELAVALLGTLKAGGAYVPLDPAYPRERLELMAGDAGLAALVTEGRLAAALPLPGVWRVLLDEPGGAAGRESGADPEPWTRPGNLAYVIYTSGSTGRPKGVASEHRSAVERMRWARAAFSDEELSGVLASTSVCFDLSVFELFAPLSWGGTAILADNALELPRLAAAAEVTLLNTVPSAMAELAAGELPPRLGTVCLAGEPLRPGLAARVREHPQVRRLLNLYGPSEDTTYSTVSEVEPGAVRVTVGGPLPGTRAYLLDRHLRPAPVGVPGELFLAGRGLARGYLGRPELTAERFLPDPWGAAPGERMYRTGDLARRLPSGEIDFLGRVDHQVKVRGFRIELGEIEAALAAHPWVAEAVVLAREDLPGGRDLVAYVVPAADGAAAGELRDYLRSKLPAYMVPGRFVMLEALPRTATGKVDRRALPAPAQELPGAGTAPRTPVEELVAGAWAEVLGRGPVGREDDFFALGGHSLLATQVVSRLRGALGVDLPLRAFFASPTVAGVAAAVEDRRRGGALPAAPMEPAPRDVDLPLSFAQRRLWFLHELEPDSPAYNLPLAVRLAGDLDQAVLAGVLSAIVARHEPLRTTFRVRAGEPVQVVAAPAPLPLPLVDLAALPGGAKELEALRLTAGEAKRPFDLAHGPVLRALLLRLAAGEHRFLLTLHHIAGDGWSLDLLLRELATLYRGASAERREGLPPLPVRYADFAVWQRSGHRDPVLAEQLSWWQRQLAFAPAPLELPMEHPYPAVQTSRGAAAGRLLAPELSRRIEELGRREGTTPFMTLLAALAALLHRYTGQDDLVLGTPIAGRTRAETEGLIGCFLNTLALRVDLSGDPTARELLGRVRETALGAFDHQDVPFESLLGELRLERDLSRTPLFQVALNWLGFGAGSERLELPGLVLERLSAAEPFAKFDLEIYAGPQADGIFLQAVYRKDLFAPAQIDDLLAHFEALLAGLAAGTDLRLSELPPAAAWDGGRCPWTAEAGDGFPREALGRSIAERFAAQAAAHAGRPAVVSREGAWTYAELAREADRVAHALLALRGFREDRVALLFSPGPAMVAAVLGALAAGKTYVPLDPSYPRERLLYMLADSGAGAVLAGDDRRALARELTAELPVAGFGELPPAPEGWAPPPVPPEALAYLLYTSGSTGRPKGVMQSQQNVLGHIRNYSLRLGLGPADRVLLLASYSFDAAVMDLFGALLNGAALCLWDLKGDGPEGLGRWLAEQAVTVYHSTPTVYRAFLDGLAPGESFPALRLVVLGGEESRRQDLERLRETFAPGCRLVNGLGPTESTLTLQRFLDPGEPIARASLPVGWPVEETRVRVQNGAGEQPAVWGTGEIGISSPYLAVGYWQRPDLTAERFVPDGGGEPGARLYRTGDLARRLPGGELEFLGRADGQVKIRGFRIETGEVEAALAGHPGVREAAVVAREDGGERYLAAYVAPAPEGAPEPAALRAFLCEQLPDYMVPAAFVLLEKLPLTPNGKLDRRALPAPERGTAGSWVAPRGPVEEILAGIWAELLDVELAGAHDDFFALGGHSLLATRVVSRVRRSLGVELPLRAVFESPTVAGLASRVEEALRGGQAGRPPIERRPPAEGGSPLSFAQERLWFLDRLEPGSAAYNMPAALSLTGPLDLPALAASLAEIVRRHEVLRTTFAEVSGSPVPEVAPPGPLPLPLVDFSGLPGGRRAEADLEAARLVREEVGLPFDLARGPLLRLRALRLGDGEHLVLFTVHHIAADGWSLALFAREVAALYPAFLCGAASPLPELPLQYADFAAWQRRWLAGEALEGDLAWWRQRLAGAPDVLDLPADRPRPAAPSGRGGSRAFVLPGALAAELGAVARQQGSTLFMVLLAAFQAWLHRLTGEEDLCIGAPAAGRTQVETEALIGLFTNTLVLRGNPAGALPWRELLARARETVLAAHAHQDLPFERLVEELRPERALGRSPLFQVLLVLQNTPGGPVSIPGLGLEVLALPAGGAKLDLSLTWRELPEGLSGQIEYAADLFDGVTAARWQAQLATLLAGLGGRLDAPVSALPLLSEGERHQLLVEWSDTGAEDDRAGLCLHELIVAQGERTPDAVAVVSESGDLTYGELLEQSGRQAARLAAAGVGPGSFVPLVLGSSPELVAGMLAVMRAGAAFVPLDPEWPEARRREILDELAGLSGFSGLSAGLAGARAAGPEAPIYAIYTSGSTGRPKGVVVPHRGIVNRFLWMDRRFGPAAECVLQTTRPIYDSAVWQIFWPLTRGGKTVLTPSRWGLDPASLAGAIERHGVTMADFVPSVFNLLMERVAEGAEPRERLASLRAVVVGGEEMDLGAARTFRRLYPEVLAVNLYGPTEASIGCICHPVGEERRERVPIGRPIDNVAALVLDAAGSPVPAGAPGELFLAGRCVGIGYLEDPEKTARAFLPNPLGPIRIEGGHERMYRTGDRVRWLPDGSLEFLGRLDRQVKIRGLRIELGEIEAALASLPGVREAAVVARDLRLVAYVAGDATAGELRRSLRERLPESLVPAAFVTLAALPLTPGGKVDRKALPEPERQGDEESYLAPRTPVEEVVAGLWAGLLGLARVGAADHFFDLGGHSLLATQVMSRLRSAFGVEMPLRDLFEAPRLADLAARVETARRAGAVPLAPPLVPVPREGPLPLSFAQQRLWFLDRMEPGNAAYNVPGALRLSGALRVDALAAALGEAARRHESLRTGFPGEGEPRQEIVAAARIELPWIDLTTLPAAARAPEADALLRNEAGRPFDLAVPPLLRACLVRLGEE
ncbi:MAG TPA: amino acid adenylation domain-containing protein, partial [Thermoanaerobaculia bacterium]|nr:amino acid adenylation domain-containing protein [Thermoanaerobaculia bacterium]